MIDRRLEKEVLSSLKLLFVLAGLLFFSTTNGQEMKPEKWNFSSKKIAADTYEVHFTVTVEQPWHIYSQNTPEGGPMPTQFKFKKNPLLKINKILTEKGNMVKKHEPVFDVDVIYYTDKVDFILPVTRKSKVKTNLSGTIHYMICNDDRCLPPQSVPFNLSLQ